MSVRYWDNYNTKYKLRLAWAKVKTLDIPKYGKFKNKHKLIKLLKSKPINTSFEYMYKICYDFKSTYFNATKEEKIERLIELSKIQIYNKIPYDRRRKKKHPVSFGRRCWICPNKASISHHIILINNGGFDNGINRIDVCEDCHKLIHPWLEIKNG
jgi:hypothetical protein